MTKVTKLKSSRIFLFDFILREYHSRPLFKSAIAYATATSAVKFVSFFKEALIAATFGVSGNVDIYLVALMLIGIPLGMLIVPIQTTLIPLYIKTKIEFGQAESSNLLNETISAASVLLVITLIIWIILLPNLTEYLVLEFDSKKMDSISKLFYLLIPYYFFNGFNLLGYSILQSENKFWSSAFLPIFSPLISIICVFSFSAIQGVKAILIGLVLGTIVEWLFLNLILSKQGMFLFITRFKISFEVKNLFKGSSILLVGSIFGGFLPMVEQLIALDLGEGNVSSIAYAFKLPAMLSGILVTTVGVTVLPHFSSLIVQKQYSLCKSTFVKYVIFLLVGGVLLAGTIIYFSEFLVRFVFERGAFERSDTLKVTDIQKAYLLQIPGALISMLSARMLIAFDCLGKVTTVGLITVVISAAISYYLSRIWGSVGIALGVSIAMTLSALINYLLAITHLNKSISWN